MEEELKLRWDMASIILALLRVTSRGCACNCSWWTWIAVAADAGTVQGMGLAGNALCISGLKAAKGCVEAWGRLDNPVQGGKLSLEKGRRDGQGG